MRTVMEATRLAPQKWAANRNPRPKLSFSVTVALKLRVSAALPCDEKAQDSATKITSALALYVLNARGLLCMRASLSRSPAARSLFCQVLSFCQAAEIHGTRVRRHRREFCICQTTSPCLLMQFP